MRFHTPITVNQPTLISISPTPYSFTAQSPRFCAQSLHTPFHAHSTPFHLHNTPIDCIHSNNPTLHHGIPFRLHHSLSLLSSSYSTHIHLYSSHIYSYHFYNDSSLFTPNHSKHSPSLRFTTPIHSVEESLTPIITLHNNTLSFNSTSTRFSYSISTRFILHESSSPFSLPLSVSRHSMLIPLPFSRNPFPDEIGGATHILHSFIATNTCDPISFISC